jgi:hypothetical protein
MTPTLIPRGGTPRTASACERTDAHTRLALAWLWHRRGCRALAEEVGVYASGRVCRVADGRWRVDVVGSARKPSRRRASDGWQWRVDVVEVKGHRADWMREARVLAREPEHVRSVRSKWHALAEGAGGRAGAPGLWLLVSHDVADADLKLLPVEWGVLRADAYAVEVEVVRDCARARWSDAAPDDSELWALSCAGRRRLPTMGRDVASALTAWRGLL